MNKLVQIRNETAICTSLQVAEKFEKRHQEILYAIEGRKCSCDGKGCKKCQGRGYQQLGLLQEDLGISAKSHLSKMFAKTSYRDSGGRKRPLYLMNRDGFSLLAMGFTGKDALRWKLEFIKAFNAMEFLLLERQTTHWQATRLESKSNRRMETDEIKEFVAYAKERGSHSPDKYYIHFSNLANNAAGIQSDSRDRATANQLNTIILIEHIIGEVIKDGIRQELYYKDIYKACKSRIEQFQKVAYLAA